MPVSFGREVASVLLKSLAVLMTIILVIVALNLLYESEQAISDGECNIAFIPVEGAILPFSGLIDFPLVTTPREVDGFIQAAEKEEGIEAILIEVNSPGGTPVASQRIAERIHNSSLPVVVLIGDIAASGGYMVAAAADHIIASPMSDVGSIGVNMSYVEESKKNEEEGLTYVQLTSAEFKDAGSTNRPITDEERDLFEADLQLVHDEFVKMIAEYRSLDVETVRNLADGASMPGGRALENNLVDSLGGVGQAHYVLAELINKPVEEIKICEYTANSLIF